VTLENTAFHKGLSVNGTAWMDNEVIQSETVVI